MRYKCNNCIIGPINTGIITVGNRGFLLACATRTDFFIRFLLDFFFFCILSSDSCRRFAGHTYARKEAALHNTPRRLGNIRVAAVAKCLKTYCVIFDYDRKKKKKNTRAVFVF